MKELLGLREYPGYFGIFTRQQSDMAEFQNGSRIKKVWSEEGDGTPLGTEGTVLGSISHPDVGVFYFVEWDNRRHFAVGVVAKKLGAA